ncbi:unnamed protein product [Paramecium sonneborni]|uniref:Uncharacterized protein n=1 Tax=Paramecium sonneborni TaxID=65129 RepID=A0A8S1JVZ9_9CILI|nr:unnamed protein product [Paramecium sonneborni]
MNRLREQFNTNQFNLKVKMIKNTQINQGSIKNKYAINIELNIILQIKYILICIIHIQLGFLMCSHLYPGLAQSLMEIAICSNEDCVYKFHPQCMKCAFKFCQNHFKECSLGNRIQELLNQLLRQNENLEKKLYQLQSNTNKKMTQVLFECRQFLNRIQQFTENCLFQDIIPINLDIDFIQELVDQISLEIQTKFQIIMSYFEELKYPFNLQNRSQSKIHQKRSIIFEQEGHLTESLSSINLSLNMDPQSIFSIFQKGNLLFKQHQYEESFSYLFKALLLAKKSKKKELRHQIFLTLQENCLFQMKKFSEIIEFSNKYQKIFDVENFSMFKYFAQFNKRQYDKVLENLNQINLDELNYQQSNQYQGIIIKIFLELFKMAERSKNQEKYINEQNQTEILKNSLKQQNQSQIKQTTQEDCSKDINSIIFRFKKAMQQLVNIIYENDDEKDAFLQQNQQFILTIEKNKINLVNLPSKSQTTPINLQDLLSKFNSRDRLELQTNFIDS